MLNERAKTEQLFFLYSLITIKKKVAKMHVFEAPKYGHAGDVALLAFRQYLDSSPTNLFGFLPTVEPELQFSQQLICLSRKRDVLVT